ncbi:IclR family transcriptional regulator [Chachezhania antarctica]|uniref:IclR family transcriptional regulator n=1 Tax=Chachezhania antarctica TaxID=2340860 RepID=UPI000EB19323|nr:IclR family transcriptional regulator [Chachezhania antarctica]|tara:strand:- start:2936 stop:3733 length:798 start_codon:yes stop_codon:yes gene_type:complete
MNEFELYPDEEQDAPGKKRTATIQSISVAMRFLSLLAATDGPLPLGDLAKQARVGRSTAHRYMQSLVKEGMAVQDPASSQYDLGPAALTMGIAALRRVDAVEMAGVQMKQLAHSSALSCGVTIWNDRGPTLVRWYRSAHFAIAPLQLGDTLPIDNTAVGLVFQAFLPRARIEAARRVQPDHFRGTPPDKTLVDRIRTERWAELTSHLLSNVTGQAAPILDAQGELSCVVTTVTDLGRLRSPDDRHALQEVARVINRATGGLSYFD